MHKDAPYCGSCYGTEEKAGDCCNSCEDVRERYRQRGWAFGNLEGIEQCKREGYSTKLREQMGEGCNIYGFLEVNKVRATGERAAPVCRWRARDNNQGSVADASRTPSRTRDVGLQVAHHAPLSISPQVAGNFHFAPGKSFQQGSMHVHDLMPLMEAYGPTHIFNMTHTIESLSFGAQYPGLVNPLDRVTNVQIQQGAMYQYFTKVVPTYYQDIRGALLRTNQFSVTEHVKDVDLRMGKNLPGVFFFYDINPIQARGGHRKESVRARAGEGGCATAHAPRHARVLSS